MIAIVGYDMGLSIRLMVLSSVVAFAPIANAGGLDDVVVEQPVIVVDEGSSSSVPNPAFSLGSLGGSGAVVGVLAVALVAASLASSGSH